MKNQEIPKENWGVHETHCCVKHGCKYWEEKCPVANGLAKQKYDCQIGSEMNEICAPGKDIWADLFKSIGFKHTGKARAKIQFLEEQGFRLNKAK